MIPPAGILLAAFLSAGPALGEEVPSSDWRYGRTVDVSYTVDFTFPENHRWRSKTPPPHVDELAQNVAMGYTEKDATVQSHWGLEFGLQGGYDTKALVPSTIPGRD